MLQQLIHNGIIVPAPPAPVGLQIKVRGRQVALTPRQEEMALAWAAKKDTVYVQDPAFVANFMRDFSEALGISPVLELDEIDFTAFYEYVDAQRAIKASRTPEERKALAAERKAQREALKAEYGYAIVNGQRVELGTYMTEPSGIFMGRGEHPLRGRWKEGAHQDDITLNLSPDAPPIGGQWAEIVWQPESLWVARWKDKLSGKLKYIWLSDTAPVKQKREARKFDKAIALEDQLELVRSHIEEGLVHEHPRRRMIATACYLIDALCLRVGDEKDPDEADTVGATTLRPEHVKLHQDGRVEFDFLGKDSVRWHKTITPPRVVWDNLAELIREARPSGNSNGGAGHPTRDLPQIFPDVTSRDVNAFLSGIMPGLTAKVFRTHHATMAVQESLAGSGVATGDPEYIKWEAANLANLEAAVLCSHTKQATGNWERTRARYDERQDKAKDRVDVARAKLQEATERLKALREEAREKREAAATPEARAKVRTRYEKRLGTARRRVETARERRIKAQTALGKIKAQAMIAGKKRTWNLGTSLRAYIDPRVYARWGQQVDYDVINKYYPTALRRKYAWVRFEDDDESGGDGPDVIIRPCMSADLPAVSRLFALLCEQKPGLTLPTSADGIESRFLPALDRSWREALVVLGEEDEVVALAVLGPAWEDGDGGAYLDLFGAMRPEWDGDELADVLAGAVMQRFEDYRLQRPRQQIALLPQDETWFPAADSLRRALLGDDDDVEGISEPGDDDEAPDDIDSGGDAADGGAADGEHTADEANA